VDILRRGEHITEFRPEELIKGWKPVGEGEKKEDTKKGKTLFDLKPKTGEKSEETSR